MKCFTHRRQWADYFDKHNVQYAFFSAANATAIQQARRDVLLQQTAGREDDSGDDQPPPSPDLDDSNETESTDTYDSSECESESSEDDSSNNIEPFDEEGEGVPADSRTKVLSVLELEDLFKEAAPSLSGKSS